MKINRPSLSLIFNALSSWLYLTISLLAYFNTFYVNAQELQTNTLELAIKPYNSGNYNRSLTISDSLINLKKELITDKDSLILANLYFYKGASQYYLEKYNASITAYNTAIHHCPNTNEGHNYKGKMYYERAFSEYGLGAGLFGYKSSKMALEILKDVENPDYDYLLSIYADLAGEASYYGFYEAADNYIENAYTLYNKHKNKLTRDEFSASKPVLFLFKRSTIINNKIEFSDSDEAELLNIVAKLQHLKDETSFNATENLMFAIVLNYLGDFFLRKDNSSKKDIKLAHYYLDIALKSIDKTTHSNNYYQFLFNKAKAYKLDKKYTNALFIINNIINKTPKNDDRLSFFYSEKANILLAANQKENALNYITKSIKEIHSDTIPLLPNFSNFAPSQDINETGLLVEMADIIIEKYPKDSIVLSLASKMYSNGLNQFKNCYQDNVLNNKLKTYYDLAIKGILKTKQLGYNSKITPKTLLNTIETIENRLAWKQFNLNRTIKDYIIPDTLQYKEIEIRTKLVEAKKASHKKAIKSLNTELNNYRSIIGKEYPLISAFNYEDYNIESLQANMATDAIILKYKKCGDKLFLFTAIHNSVNFFEIENANLVLQQLNTYYNIISKMGDNLDLANTLYKALIPLNIDRYKFITIIPDTSISHLPFETLVTNKKQYLIESKTIAYAQHLVFLNPIKNQVNTSKNDLVIFTPKYKTINDSSENYRNQNYHLQGAKNETNSLQTLFKTKHYKASNATKENFIKNSDSSKIIHLAMHAKINLEMPELSYFSFSKEDKMYLEELYSLKLNSELVVLSACNTGKKIVKSNKGITSLSRAFTFAGVPSNVASLWSIPDKTTKTIMVNFYNHLKNGENKAEALANSKREYLQLTADVNLKKPFYWAGFIINGDMQSIQFDNNDKLYKLNYLLLIISILTCLSYILYRVYYKS